MDEKEHRGFRVTRRTVLESGTVTAAFMLGGFPQLALANASLWLTLREAPGLPVDMLERILQDLPGWKPIAAAPQEARR